MGEAEKRKEKGMKRKEGKKKGDKRKTAEGDGVVVLMSVRGTGGGGNDCKGDSGGGGGGECDGKSGGGSGGGDGCGGECDSGGATSS
jgi:hypothetical protein